MNKPNEQELSKPTPQSSLKVRDVVEIPKKKYVPEGTVGELDKYEGERDWNACHDAFTSLLAANLHGYTLSEASVILAKAREGGESENKK